jgi:solute carrier family 25 aspartate/glutamate transporter 12/13
MTPKPYQGHNSVIHMTSSLNCVQMNDWIRDRFTNRKGQVPLHGEILAGACAGGCSALVVNPFEIVKIRMQAAGQLFPKAKLGAWKVIKTLGVTGMYKV